MAENSKHESGSEGAEGEEDCKGAVYIVYTEQPPEGVDAETHHLRTLSSVLGSEEAAKDALIYVYKTAATGFSAKLTPEQVTELTKAPGVIQVVESRRLELQPVPGMNARSH